jgi:molybdopterin-guanine dinucleotide biosynthesis protein A
MGRDKGSILIGDICQWRRSVDCLQTIFSEVIYVTNDRDFKATDKDLIVTYDEVPYLGPLGGILAGLKLSSGDRIFVAAFDMPFVNPNLVRFLVDCGPNADVVVPVVAGKREPLHAIYSRSCLQPIVSQLTAGKRKVSDLFRHVNVLDICETVIKRFDPSLHSFFNINTWDDVRSAERILREQRS